MINEGSNMYYELVNFSKCVIKFRRKPALRPCEVGNPTE